MRKKTIFKSTWKIHQHKLYSGPLNKSKQVVKNWNCTKYLLWLYEIKFEKKRKITKYLEIENTLLNNPYDSKK